MSDSVIPAYEGEFGAHLCITNDDSTKRLLALSESVARTPSTVLLSGESGAGKEVIARFIHRKSNRANRAFVAINCAALPQSLLESELFGHEKGSFSGAVQRHIGVFERAKGGTLLLDEISEIAPVMQAKLLRVLQERTMFRVGGREPIKLDIRIIATTNQELKKCVEEGSFRLDLYYRLNVFPLKVPSLRERPGDIEPLTRYFLGKVTREMGSTVRGITRSAMNKLRRYGFPGNVRELLNIVERGVILAQGKDCVDECDIMLETNILAGPMPLRPTSSRMGDASENTIMIEPGEECLSDILRRVILGTLARYDGNRTRTAEALGVSLRTVRNRLREYREAGIAIPG